jgi:hypothetical protein
MTMKSPLQLLFEEIDQLQDEDDLRSHFAPKIGEYFIGARKIRTVPIPNPRRTAVTKLEN